MLDIASLFLHMRTKNKNLSACGAVFFFSSFLLFLAVAVEQYRLANSKIQSQYITASVSLFRH